MKGNHERHLRKFGGKETVKTVDTRLLLIKMPTVKESKWGLENSFGIPLEFRETKSIYHFDERRLPSLLERR